MKNILLLVIGIIIGASGMYFMPSKDSDENQEMIIKTQIIKEKTNPTMMTKTTHTNLSSKDNNQVDHISNEIKAEEKTENEANNDSVKKTINFDDERKKLHQMIDNLKGNDLIMARGFLENLGSKSPKEIFKNEKRDSEWAQKNEDKITYTFYEKQPGDGLIELDSVECKSTLCRVKINLAQVDKEQIKRGAFLINIPGTRITQPAKDYSEENPVYELYIDPSLAIIHPLENSSTRKTIKVKKNKP